MLHFPLMLMGFALVPFIAVQVMIMSERSTDRTRQPSVPSIEIL